MVKDSEILTKKYFDQKLDQKLDEKLDQKLDQKLDEKLSNFITKDYLDNKLSDFVTKKYLDNKLNDFVTKKYLRVELDKQKTDIIREVRIMMHETMESGMENMKLYYQEETNRHMTALLQGFKDEMLVYKDQFRSFMEKLDNHEHRIVALERV